MFYSGLGQSLLLYFCVASGFALFWVAPFGFSLVFPLNGFERKIKGQLLENQSQPTPGPLRSFLLGLSILCHFSFTRNGEGRIQSGPLWICSGLSHFTMRNERKTNRKPSPAVSQASPELILLSSLLRTCTRQVSSESHCCVYAREK